MYDAKMANTNHTAGITINKLTIPPSSSPGLLGNINKATKPAIIGLTNDDRIPLPIPTKLTIIHVLFRNDIFDEENNGVSKEGSLV